jgi:hypothetical protein
MALRLYIAADETLAQSRRPAQKSGKHARAACPGSRQGKAAALSHSLHLKHDASSTIQLNNAPKE